MLLSFSVKNFRSFREEQTLSLVANNRQTNLETHLQPIPDDENKALPVAVIYGANGAGKSNLVKALSFLAGLVNRGTEPKARLGRSPFLFDKTSASEPTEFSIQFVEGGQVYAFGCKLLDQQVQAEWLSVLTKGKEVSLYERLTEVNGEVTIEAGPALKNSTLDFHGKIPALIAVGVLPNQLFLHSVGSTLSEKDQGTALRGALGWFRKRLNFVSADSEFPTLPIWVARSPKFAEFAGSFLKKAATGVEVLRAESVSVDDSILGTFPLEVQNRIKEIGVGNDIVITKPDKTEFLITKRVDGFFQVGAILTEHQTHEGERVTLPFSEESDGTQRLTQLLPALFFLNKEPSIFIIDEIDRSLHPLLAKALVREFLRTCAGKGSQLIFTTHETAFLDQELLRRDEIWFANKNPREGATELYSLADYQVRKDLALDKAYLQGRFKAVPPLEVELPDWVHQIMEELKPKTSPEVLQPS